MGAATRSEVSLTVTKTTAGLTSKAPSLLLQSIPLTNAAGELICGANPLDGSGSGVVTGYTEGVETFDHVYHCGDNPGEQRYAGDALELNGEPLVFAEVAGGFTVKVGDTTSAAFPLPPGHTLNRCCIESCCDLE